MTEFVHNTPSSDIRRQLLATASALTLVGAFGGAKASATDQPTVWIELGGQFEQIATDQEMFAPPFTALQAASGPLRSGVAQIPLREAQSPLAGSFGAQGKISFQPEGTDWVFSAGIRYGQSSGAKHLHQSSQPQPYHFFSVSLVRTSAEFSDETAKKSEKHAILDFQAGKDVGLGLFGNSVMNFGVRIAQFHTSLLATLGRDPINGGYKYFFGHNIPTNNPHTFRMQAQATRNFHGMGPSVSWEGSAPFAGHTDSAEFTIDWGANAAMLFGRQKAIVQHRTYAASFPPPSQGNPNLITIPVYTHVTPVPPRSRMVTVPNIGGMAAMSLKFPNAKVSLGYRADFFFGAMDGGIDTAHRENVGFYSPFASVSVGLGG